MAITIEVTVAAPRDEAWRAWTTPADIEQWNAASDDWHCPQAEHDLRPGGRFCYRMAARDGSEAFDYAGTFTRVASPEELGSTLDDGRAVTVTFTNVAAGTLVRETFDPFPGEPEEMQRDGWQAILDRFARHVAAGG